MPATSTNAMNRSRISLRLLMLITALAAVVFFVRFYVLENRIRRTDWSEFDRYRPSVVENSGDIPSAPDRVD
jgi:hypothetical protein